MIGPSTGLAQLRFSLVGAGRVGSSLASWATQAGARLVSVASRSGGPALAARLGGQIATIDQIQSHQEDLLLLAVPDSALTEVAALLAGRKQARIVLHTSGSAALAVLAPLARQGSAIGGCHPLRAFPEPSQALADAAAIFFALDGDPAAVELGRRLAEAWGGSSAVVPPEARLLYHFAATLAAGGVATLVAVTHELAAALQLPPAAAQGYLELARSAIAAAERAPSPAAAITGPLARADGQLVLAELQALEAQAPELAPLALALARETLRQLRRAGRTTADHRQLATKLAAVPPPPTPSG